MSERSSRRSAHVATVTASRKNAPDLTPQRYSTGEFASPSAAASGQTMHSAKLCFALVVLAVLIPRNVSAQAALGAQGAEGEPNRLQQWLVPTPDSATPAHAVLFRPPGDGPFPLALIAHASTQNVLRRAQMPQPEYRAVVGPFGGSRLCGAGAGTARAWRHGRKISGGSRRLRRSGLFARRPRDRRRDRRRHGLPAPATLHPGRRYGDRRPLRRRMGCAGPGRRAAAEVLRR